MSIQISGAMVARYFEKVLGVRLVTPFALPAQDVIKEPVTRVTPKQVCLLVEVGDASKTPSLQQMGSRMLEAVRGEWIKKSISPLPEFEWLQVEPGDWAQALIERKSDFILAIVCGAVETAGNRLERNDARVMHVPSFHEMNSSPVLKREAWRAIQEKIAGLETA